MSIILLINLTWRSPAAWKNAHKAAASYSTKALVRPGPDSPLRDPKWVSHTEVYKAGFSGAWVQTILSFVLCSWTWRAAWNMGRDSLICGEVATRGLQSLVVYLQLLQCLTARLGQVTSFCSTFNPPPISYQGQVEKLMAFCSEGLLS